MLINLFSSWSDFLIETRDDHAEVSELHKINREHCCRYLGGRGWGRNINCIQISCNLTVYFGKCRTCISAVPNLGYLRNIKRYARYFSVIGDIQVYEKNIFITHRGYANFHFSFRGTWAKKRLGTTAGYYFQSHCL